MAKKQEVKILYNGQSYDMIIPGWHNHLYGDGSDAIYEIHTDDMILFEMETTTVGDYKKQKKNEYNNLSDTAGMSFHKYLHQSFKLETGREWDDCISLLKTRINNHIIPYFLGHKKNVTVNERTQAFYRAASNGHVASMFFIGTAQKDGSNPDCLYWLSRAHNRGHVGACYEMASYFDKEGDILNSIRCLIIAADGGMDLAYMGILDIGILLNILKLKNITAFDSMLDELIRSTHNSCARYFKSVQLLASGDINNGIQVMVEFRKNTKKKPADKNLCETYYKQLDFMHEFIDLVLGDITNEISPIESIISRTREFSDIERFKIGKAASGNFADFDECCKKVHEILNKK